MVMVLTLLKKMTITKINFARSHSKLEVQKTDDELAKMTEEGAARIISDLKDILKCKVG